MRNEARVLRCTLLNGSAWSTEKKYVRRHRRKVRYFFGERAKIEEGGNGGAAQQGSQGRDGDLQVTQQELPKKEQAVKIEIIRQEESSWQSTAALGG